MSESFGCPKCPGPTTELQQNAQREIARVVGVVGVLPKPLPTDENAATSHFALPVLSRPVVSAVVPQISSLISSTGPRRSRRNNSSPQRLAVESRRCLELVTARREAKNKQRHIQARPGSNDPSPSSLQHSDFRFATPRFEDWVWEWELSASRGRGCICRKRCKSKI